MKKLITAVFGLLLFVNSASAELGINVGVSGQLGLFAATATETDTGTHGTTTGDNETNSESEFLGLGYASLFIEKELGIVAIGVDYVPSALETETSETIVDDQKDGAATAKKTNKVQVDFEDLTTIYLALNVTENAYIKAGYMQVDVITNENLQTGSTYKNTDLDGTLLGIGYHKEFDNGVFLRAEGNYMEFDGASVTSSTGSQKISLDSLDGVSGKLSLGKSF